jgi:hypothetical protein
MMFVHCRPRHKRPAFWRELSVGASFACVFFQWVEQENDVLSFSARGIMEAEHECPDFTVAADIRASTMFRKPLFTGVRSP